MGDNATAEALEQARCAYINLYNLVKMAPLIRDHPMVSLVRFQIRATIEGLNGEEGKSFCDHMDLWDAGERAGLNE